MSYILHDHGKSFVKPPFHLCIVLGSHSGASSVEENECVGEVPNLY